MVLTGQGGLSPFSSQERELRPDTGLPKKVGARDVGMKEGMEAKVWSRVSRHGVQSGGQCRPHRLQPPLVMVQAPQMQELAHSPNKWT